MKRKNKKKQEELEIKAMVSLMHEYELSLIPENKELQERYHLSDMFYRKMDKLMETQKKKARRKELIKTAAAVAAVIVIIFAVTNPKTVVQAAQWLIRWFDEYVSFQFRENTDVNWVPRYELRYVPEGYVKIVDEYYDGAAGYIEYEGKDMLWFNLDYGLIDGGMNVNNENMDFFILTGSRGETIYYLQAQNPGDDSSMTWVSDDETTKFNLMGNLSKEELLKIQKEIHIKK